MKVWIGIWFLMPALFGLDLDVAYLWRLARGQMGLMWRAEPIERVLKRRDLDPEQREKLELVQAIRAFARDSLGLGVSKQYATFADIGRGPVSWNLVACPKDRLEPLRWTYPVVGTVPYRGYFGREEAEAARDRYEAEGYDTHLRPVSAYSTLGWFPDPVLSTMLRYGEADLADVIIHELTHATVWIEADATFNESMASFVGETGALMWLQTRYGDDAPEVQRVLDERADHAVFRRFLHGVAAQLDSLYATDISFEEKLVEREKVFEEARRDFLRLPLKTDLYGHFPNWTLNNARLSLYRVYQARTDIFARVYDAVGWDLKVAIGIFEQCAQARDPVRWLENYLERSEK